MVKKLLTAIILVITLSAARPVPRLVLFINIEQMRSDYLTRYSDKFTENGFKRLLREGASCSNASMNLHVLKNVTGVATLFTGVYPNRHGIVSEWWLDRVKDRETNAINDPYCITVGSDSKEGQRSAAMLLSPTVGDELRIRTKGQAKVFAVAVNDYSAVMSAGHAANGAYWMDNQTGNMISSSYYMGRFPGWGVQFNSRKMTANYAGQEWNLLLTEASYAASLPDDNKAEKGYFGRLKTFPYKLNQLVSETGNYKVIKTTPYANTVVNEFAMELMRQEQLGKDDIPDLLTVSFASMDYENESFGPFSMEMEDIYLRLDKEIELLLNEAEKQTGAGRTLVILTSACSASHSPDYLKNEFRMPVGYVNPESMTALLKSFLNITYGQGDWIKFSGEQQIYLNRELIAKNKLELAEVQEKTATFINDFEGVKLSLASTDIQKGDFANGHLAVMAASFNMKRSGDILYMLDDGWQTQYKFRPACYTDNRNIPLLWYGQGIRKKLSHLPVDAIDVAPTLFEILELGIPTSFEGRIIEEIIE